MRIGEATLRGERGAVTLQIDGESPAGVLTGRLSVEVRARGVYTAASDMSLPASDLTQFVAALETIDRDLSGDATLGRDPDYFQVRVHMDRGKGSFSGIVYDAGAELRFDGIQTDQTFIADALAQFSALAHRPPS